MPRPKEDQKQAVKAAIDQHLHLNGPSNWGEVMAQFPGVSRATFFRYVNEVKEEIEGRASSHGTAELKLAQKRIRSSTEVSPDRTEKKIKAQLPAAPSPAIISSMPGEVAAATFDFMAYFNDIVRDTAMLRDASVTKNEDGTEKLKNPMLMERSVARRISIIETWLHSMEAVWNLEKMQELYRVIVEEIGRVDPETQQAILVRLRELNNRTGMTMDARIR